MGGQQFDGAVRQRPHLDTGTGQCDPGDPLLYDATVLLEGGEIHVEMQGFRPPVACRGCGRLIAGRLVGEPAAGDPAGSTQSTLLGTRDASLSLHDRLGERGPPRPHALYGGHDLVDGGGPPPRPGTSPASSSNILRQPVLLPRSASRIAPVHRQSERQRDVRAPSGGGVVRDEVTAGPRGRSTTDLAQKSRSRKQFRAERDRGRVTRPESGVSRARAWLGITPGSKPRQYSRSTRTPAARSRRSSAAAVGIAGAAGTARALHRLHDGAAARWGALDADRGHHDATDSSSSPSRIDSTRWTCSVVDRRRSRSALIRRVATDVDQERE